MFSFSVLVHAYLQYLNLEYHRKRNLILTADNSSNKPRFIDQKWKMGWNKKEQLLLHLFIST